MDSARIAEVVEQMRENVVATMLNSRQWTLSNIYSSRPEVGLAVVFRWEQPAAATPRVRAECRPARGRRRRLYDVDVLCAAGNRETMRTGAMGTPGHARRECIDMIDFAGRRFCERARQELAALGSHLQNCSSALNVRL
jgi:hypothetical protein